MSSLVGRYRVLRTLGEGGMGVVYEAVDDRLGRTVAVKVMHEALVNPAATERFWREARAAAALSHPQICQIYELGDDGGRPFIVMERLIGETLADRLARGAIPAREAAQLALGLLDALAALHAQQMVHRDLKPSNVFLTAHGIKLLDFGLAHELTVQAEAGATRLTTPGMVVGTPHYMAPEQITGGAVDVRTDIFAVGALLFEMLSGQTAFGGPALLVLQKVLHEQPPALVGSPLVNALDAVIHRALTKNPAQRFASATEMAADLRHALLLDDSGEAARVRALTRVVVLPFRLLRPDPDIDFLAFSLPDAITASLSAHDGISVRSPLAAARFAGEALNLEALAEELDLDHVLTGTLMRSGERIRVSVQLIEAPSGRVLWSHAAEAALGDLFELQDTLSQGIVGVLPIAEAGRARQDVPRTARAYELYLRANQLALESSTYRLAQTLYERCLEEDPDFAPAWAQLGRAHRVIGKYLEPEAPTPSYEAAERAFQRALALNPDLPVAHSLYSSLESEMGRAEQAMGRVLERLRLHPANPHLLAALVHSCRYCGLLDASLAAHERARRLDPQIRTSVLHTYFMLGDYQRCLDESQWLTDPLIAVALVSLGRLEDARTAIRLESERFAGNTVEKYFISHLSAFVDGTTEQGLRDLETLVNCGFRDGEGLYYSVRSYARLGALDTAIDLFARILDFGFFCYPTFARDPWLDPLRAERRFIELLRGAEARHREAAQTFVRHGGDRLLGVRLPA